MAAKDEIFSETTGTLARKAHVHPDTVRIYVDLGLLECIRLPSGIRLFKPSATREVKRIHAKRLKRRGGNHKQMVAA